MCKFTGIVKNQGNMIPLKEQGKLPVTDPKEMAIHELPDRIQNNSSKDAQRSTREHR